MIIETVSVRETEDAGEALARRLPETPCVVALYGDLGAGKTAFVRGMARRLAPRDDVRSPTYTIVCEYTSGTLPLCHFDMYRITDEDSLLSIDFDSYLERAVCVIEWSENIEPWLPDERIDVKIEKTGGDARRITVTERGVTLC
jgi:tRNA threonylcarbamoyladenosine biosynthesis protein TsaE